MHRSPWKDATKWVDIDVLKQLFGLNQKRVIAYAGATTKIMRDFLSRPFPKMNTPWDEIEIVSLDFETTGLNPFKDQILSYGHVTIDRGLIHLNTARHELIKNSKPIPEESAVIHQITDDKAEKGHPLTDILPELLQQLSGKVMLAHFNRIEMTFLEAACRRLYGSPFIIPCIDTLNLAERVYLRHNHAIQPNRLRLFHLREDFKLPVYPAHNALNDALTTAELFLALEGEITPKGPTRLKDLLP